MKCKWNKETLDQLIYDNGYEEAQAITGYSDKLIESILFSTQQKQLIRSNSVNKAYLEEDKEIHYQPLTPEQSKAFEASYREYLNNVYVQKQMKNNDIDARSLAFSDRLQNRFLSLMEKKVMKLNTNYISRSIKNEEKNSQHHKKVKDNYTSYISEYNSVSIEEEIEYQDKLEQLINKFKFV